MNDQQQHARLIEAEFSKVGFKVVRFEASVHVSLKRKLYKSEVETFLDREFEGCGFIVEQVFDGVEVAVV